MTVASALLGYLQTAAATMTAPALTQVIAGQPDTISLPTLAYWYTGTKTWEANTLSKTQELSCWHLRVYLPQGTQFAPQAGNTQAWLEKLVDAIRGQLYGAVSLGGAATGGGMTLSDATVAWIQMGTVWVQVVDMDLEAMMAAVHTIAH